MNFIKRLEIREHSAAVYSLDFDGSYLYSASADKFVTRWNLTTGTQDKFAIKFEDSVYVVRRFDQYLVAGTSAGSVHIFDLEQNKEIKHLAQHQKAIFSIYNLKTKALMVVGDADGNLSIWSTRDFSLKLYLPLNVGKIRDLTSDISEEKLIVSCQDGTIRVFDTNSFSELLTINSHSGGACTAIYFENSIISGGKDAHLTNWELDGRKLKSVPAHNFAIYRARALGSNLLLSVSRDKTIKVWDQELNILKRLDAKAGGHSHSVNDLCILSEYMFATCSDDRRIIVWERVSEKGV
jgi:WD40 repeat protein